MNDWDPSRPRRPYATQQSALGQAGAQNKQKPMGTNLLTWWYRLTTPAEQHGLNTPGRREKARRLRLASVLLLMVTITWLAAIPFFFLTLSNNPTTLPITIVGLLVIAVLLFLNRRGWVAAVAWLLIGMIYLSEFLIVRNNQANLGINEVAVFDLLIYAELLAVSLLPPLSVFPVALSNCAFILIAIFALQPPSSAFNQHVFVTNLVVEPLTLQVFVAVVTYLWVASTEGALARADQAELTAALEHRVAEERRLLANDIQQLLETLTRVANGDSTARVTLSQDRSLWQVGIALNTLLARMQSNDTAGRALQRTEEEVAVLAGALRDAKVGRPARWPLPGESLLAPLIRELAAPRSAPSSAEPPLSRSRRYSESDSGLVSKTRPIEGSHENRA